MAGKVLQLKDIVNEDQLAKQITTSFNAWDDMKQEAKARWAEVDRYVYATDTTTTSNSKLPWNNKTTIPKLCQVADNLKANYMASMFPKRKWLVWEADTHDDALKEKSDTIRDYMSWVIDDIEFKKEVAKLNDDYIHKGNCFSMPVWHDGRVSQDGGTKQQVGYVGPRLKRISPYDIVFDASADNFANAPKIIRNIVSFGEAADIIQSLSKTEEDKAMAEYLLNDMKELRNRAYSASEIRNDERYNIDGFGSYRDYLCSGNVELLYFYGDIYDIEKSEFYKNRQIIVVDRCKVAFNEANPSYFGRAPIFHSGWRKRQDNLWAMGPLENLVSMQYRIDHVENMKADLFDLTAFPPIKRKGYVEDFEWGPLAEIVVGDDGDVELMTPQTNIVSFNQELGQYLNMMEQMAGAPQEAMGIRSPGEKTKYEVQVLENSRGRIFQAKISQFEEEQIEPVLNAMLELARRQMDETVIRIVDDELKIQVFRSLTPQDITGAGRIKPLAARHFAEKADMLQNVTQFFASPLAQVLGPHISSIQLAEFANNVLELEDWNIFAPNIGITEKGEQQKMLNSVQEDAQAHAATPAGIAHGDTGPGGSIPPGAIPGGSDGTG